MPSDFSLAELLEPALRIPYLSISTSLATRLFPPLQLFTFPPALPRQIVFLAKIHFSGFLNRLKRIMAPRRNPTAVVYAPKVAERAVSSSASTLPVALPPGRFHPRSYHFPLLCNDDSSCGRLLGWFEDVEGTRSMPWRKAWINPESFMGRDEELQLDLAKRAYEIWVSEVSK